MVSHIAHLRFAGDPRRRFFPFPSRRVSQDGQLAEIRPTSDVLRPLSGK